MTFPALDALREGYVRPATVIGPSDANPVGIIGAGRLGQPMARTALRASREVVIANSRGPDSLTSVVSALGEGVSAVTVDEVAGAGIVVVAVPWDRVPEAVQGLDWTSQVVIDATNDWAADDLQGRTSSELVADLVAGARLVKAANTLGAEVLGSDPPPLLPAARSDGRSTSGQRFTR